ncbi:AAA family ATPase [Vibrio metschnikovii]|uniref:AAA family ATPase n=1 Tax=Vibrio metschnikovii TaxID=28172 RepID=UPI002FC689CC
MLTSIRVRNFRSFSNSEHNSFVDIKPLTILLGKNSSGKSSFLRTFPLLRQSVERETKGPILWFGSYVDFGAFSVVKNNDVDDENIHFDFVFELSLEEYYKYNPYLLKSMDFYDDKLKVEVRVSVSEDNKVTVAKGVKIKIFDDEFDFNFGKNDKGTLYFKGEEIPFNYMIRKSFIPSIGMFIERKLTIHGEERVIRRFNDDYLQETLMAKNIKLIEKYFHYNTSREKIYSGLDLIGLCNKDMLEPLLYSAYSDNKVFIRNLGQNHNDVSEDFYKVIVRTQIGNIINMVNQELESVFRGVRYIAPLRATAERYYRHQDLQVNEIDHTGSNLAMLLRSLPEREKKAFSIWTESNFGFSIRVEELGLHYALKIKNQHDNHEYNINDMGFGFSQILPIVATIWFETKSRKANNSIFRRKQMILTIEQPELHLHPEYQARLSRLFAKVVDINNKSKTNISIIFETHSKTMINALGDAIEDGEIESKDVNIVIFDKGEDKKFTNITFSNFSKEGDLINWPIGFFSGR